VDLVQDLFYKNDVQAIKDIKIPEIDVEDIVAWHQEKNGIFTVKSAYRLALSLKQKRREMGSCSREPNGECIVWDFIWKADVPPKVRIFGWWVATDSLVTRINKRRRTLELSDRCTICGMGDEDAYHAVVACSKSVALRQAMREVWNLPNEAVFSYTSKDWFLNLLAQTDNRMRPKNLLLLWCAWHLRNDIIHQNRKARIAESVIFLLCCRPETTSVPMNQKGKSPITEYAIETERTIDVQVKPWQRPPPFPTPTGWIKVNTNGSFSQRDLKGGVGIVIRDCSGTVLAARCSALERCQDGEEAEATAALQSIKLAISLGVPKVCLELDCAAAVSAIRAQEIDRSAHWATYEEAKKLLKVVHNHSINLVKRDSNNVADSLANHARTTGSCEEVSTLYPIIWDLVTNEMPLANTI
jgi:ribonuclease HI